jgi:large subunit ribosomal protein L25
MNDKPLSLEQRNIVGGEKAKRLRKSGYIPAVVYGHGMTSVPVQVRASDFREFIMKNGKSSLFTTEFAAEHDATLMIKDIQYDTVRNAVSHVDFQKVSLFEKVHAEVPVRIVGENNLRNNGSVVVHQLNDLTVECLPQHVPHFIDADVSQMTSGHSITAGQLKLPQGVKLLTEPNSVVLAVTGGKLDLDVSKVDEPVVPRGEEGKVRAVQI